MVYGERLKALRERIGKTLTEMSKILNISDSLYSRYEKEIQIIPLKHLIKICDIFEVSIDYIFNFNDKKKYSNMKESFNENICGKRLKEFRVKNKLTQKDLATELYVAKSMIGAYENANYLIPTHALYNLCKKYNISADYLLGRIDKKPF